MNIKIQELENVQMLTVQQLVEMAPIHLDIVERVPNITGRAFDLIAWYQVWSKLYPVDNKLFSEPTHLKVEAMDEFSATVSWSELGAAVFLYEQEGLPLIKGFPLRLYVPDGSSECLNVKSVVTLTIIHNSELAADAVYGFKNFISANELKRK